MTKFAIHFLAAGIVLACLPASASADRWLPETLPSGLWIPVVTDKPVTNSLGPADKSCFRGTGTVFTGRLGKELAAKDGRVLAHRNARVTGLITRSLYNEHVRSELWLELTSIELTDGKIYRVRTKTLKEVRKNPSFVSATIVGGLVGSFLGGENCAIIGSAVGAGMAASAQKTYHPSPIFTQGYDGPHGTHYYVWFKTKKTK